MSWIGAGLRLTTSLSQRGIRTQPEYCDAAGMWPGSGAVVQLSEPVDRRQRSNATMPADDSVFQFSDLTLFFITIPLGIRLDSPSSFVVVAQVHFPQWCSISAPVVHLCV
jgi:hypothetical protein